MGRIIYDPSYKKTALRLMESMFKPGTRVKYSSGLLDVPGGIKRPQGQTGTVSRCIKCRLAILVELDSGYMYEARIENLEAVPQVPALFA